MDPKKSAALHATTLIRDGQAVGLGAGSTIAAMLEPLATLSRSGMRLDLYTSSEQTRERLAALGLRTNPVGTIARLDLYFDGCDQFDRDLNALKSGGGIHTREKLLASMADAFIIVGDDSKWVDFFDPAIPLVLELFPEASQWVQDQVEKNLHPSRMAIRQDPKIQGPAITSQGNILLDIWFRSWPPLPGINSFSDHLCGVLENSLFFGMASGAVIGSADRVRTVEKSRRKIPRNPGPGIND